MRERILGEIKRIAEMNGGSAPGQIRFEKETGIGPNEWLGKIWARWGDAVSEAGYQQNDWNARADESKILDDFADACRHFGHPPTNAELGLYGRERTEFTSPKTFSRRFGSKNGVIAALRQRALERGEIDLINMLPEIEVTAATSPASAAQKASEGSVYLLQSGYYYKVGRSDELEKRVKQISIALPDKVELVHNIRTDDPPGIEAYWHRRFAERRANGEWFKLTPDDVRAFKRRKFQ